MVRTIRMVAAPVHERTERREDADADAPVVDEIDEGGAGEDGGE